MKKSLPKMSSAAHQAAMECVKQASDHLLKIHSLPRSGPVTKEIIDALDMAREHGRALDAHLGSLADLAEDKAELGNEAEESENQSGLGRPAHESERNGRLGTGPAEESTEGDDF
jgi:hypothetical protein